MRLGSLFFRIRFTALVVALLFFFCSANLHGQDSNPFNILNGYNLFVENNATFHKGNTEGPVAIGGNLVLGSKEDVSIAQHSAGTFKDSTDDKATALWIQGTISYEGNKELKLLNGYIKLGDKTNSSIWDRDNNKASVNTRLTKKNAVYDSKPRVQVHTKQALSTISPVNDIHFTDAFAQLKSTAITLSTLSENVSHPVSGRFTMKLEKGKLNVLNLYGEELNDFSEIVFEQSPSEQSPLLINVDALGSFTWNTVNMAGIGGDKGKYILFNFYNATQLVINGNAEIKGSILAPYAALTKNHDNIINGQVVAKSYTQQAGVLKYYTFSSELTQTPAALCSVSISISESSAYCGLNNGSVSIEVSGAGASASYLWNTGAKTQNLSNVGAGTYSVTVSDGACNASASVAVKNAESNLVVSSELKDRQIDLYVSGGQAPYAYLWNTGATIEDLPVDEMGVYSCMVTDSRGCTSETTLLIEELSVLPVDIADFEAKELSGGKVLLQWETRAEWLNDYFELQRSRFPTHGFVAVGKISGENQPAAYSFEDSVPETGTWYYRLQQVDIDGGAHISGLISIHMSVNEDTGAYPNPVAKELFVPIAAGTKRLQVYDMLGRMILDRQVDGGANLCGISFENIPEGRYWVKHVDSRLVIKTEYILVNR